MCKARSLLLRVPTLLVLAFGLVPAHAADGCAVQTLTGRLELETGSFCTITRLEEG